MHRLLDQCCQTAHSKRKHVPWQPYRGIHLYPLIAVIEKRLDRLDHMTEPKHGTEWQPFLGVPLPEGAGLPT
jgi:hypothetical protein